MKGLSKDPLRGRGLELLEAVLSANGIAVKPQPGGSLKFALRRDDHNASCNAEHSRDGGWIDFGTEEKGDALEMVARLHNLDSKRDFPRIMELSYGYLRIPIPTPEASAPKKERETPPVQMAPKPTNAEFCAWYGLEVADFMAANVAYKAEHYFFEADASIPAMIYPVHLPDGKITTKDKSFGRSIDGKRLSQGKKGSDFQKGFFGDPREARGKTLILAGGEEKRLAAVRAGFVSVSPTAGEKLLPALATWIAECQPSEVIIAFDNDDPGRTGARKAASLLQNAIGDDKIRCVAYPKGFKPKGDLNDVLIASGADGLREFLESSPAAKSADPLPATPGRPRVLIGPDEGRVTDECVAALSLCPQVFQRALHLVRVVRDHGGQPCIHAPEGTPRIQELPQASLRNQLARVVEFQAISDGEWKRAHPPKWAAEAIICQGQWKGVRPLYAVAEAPFLRPDGSIVQTSGYDPGTGVLCEFREEFQPVSEFPEGDEISGARDTLLETVADFPFAEPCHRSAWLAGLLTTVCHGAIRGPSPMFVIDANVRGSGKSLLADVAGIIATGRPMTRMVNVDTDDEMRKRLLSIVAIGSQVVLIDNVEGGLGCASLDGLLTGTTFADRVLGKSEISPEYPIVSTFWATGNNVEIRGDLVRRIIPIRLDSPEENPETRQGFTHTPLLDWIHDNRMPLLTSALTIVRGFFAAGCPKPKVLPLGSFEGWSDTIRGAVLWAGLPDPCIGRAEIAEKGDKDKNFLLGLVQVMQIIDRNCVGMTASALIALAQKGENEQRDGNFTRENASVNVSVFELLSSVSVGAGRTLPTPQSLGRKLRHAAKRVVSGFRLNSHTTKAGELWWIEQAARPKGSISLPVGVVGVVGVELPARAKTPVFNTECVENGEIYENVMQKGVRTGHGQTTPTIATTPTRNVNYLAEQQGFIQDPEQDPDQHRDTS